MDRASELFDEEGSVTFNHKDGEGYCLNPFYLRQTLSDNFRPYRKVESQRCKQDLFVRIVLVLLHNLCPDSYHTTSLYCRLYGMEWLAGHNVRFQREGINSIKLSFDSPWFPPSGESVAALSAMFDCEIRHWYSEPAHELEGFDCYNRGQHVTIDELAAEAEVVVPDNVDEPEAVDSAQSSFTAS